MTGLRCSTLGPALLFLAALLVHSLAAANELRGRIVGITDGDTVTVLTPARTQKKVRLAGIDAPEKKQAFGEAAKRRMSELAFQRDVVVHWDKLDRFGRIVGVVVVEGEDVGLALLRSGLAWHFKRYAHEQTPSDRATYARAEDLARAAGLGLWGEHQNIPPWQYRANRRH